MALRSVARGILNVRIAGSQFESPTKAIWDASTISRIASTQVSARALHTSTPMRTYVAKEDPEEPWPTPKRWPRNNEIMYPPQEPGEPRRPATYCHYRANIKYSPKKMWYIANLIRGMTIDEAIKQLSFLPKKGAQVVKDVLIEAQEIAVRDHDFEFKSNMWIGESFAMEGLCIKGFRKLAPGQITIMRYMYCHYMVRLVEGPPPKHYYLHEPNGNELLEAWVNNLRKRKLRLGK